VKQVFRWVAAAKRPLSLGELREAIAIEPGQPYSKPERLLNGMGRVTAWCENLIVVDEEDEVVQFAHHTVQQYLLGKPLEKRLSEFHFQLQDADLEAGEICVTYLNFNDFKTQLIRQPKFQAPITPSAILETALGHRAESTVAASLFQSVVSRRRQKTTKVDVAQKLADYGGGNNGNLPGKLQQEHPFLDYASENWLLHTTNFEHGKSKTWSLWTQMLLDEQSLGQTPWTHEQFIRRDRQVGKWICDENHSALLRLIQSSNRPFPAKEIMDFIEYISMKDNLPLDEDFDSLKLTTVLQRAAEAGHSKIVDTLLAAKVDVNATFDKYSRTALLEAATKGHVEIVDKLLTANADVNAVSKSGLTALLEAATEGHVEIVDKLLTAKADVNAVDEFGRTALLEAITEGHIEIVDKLLTTKADVNVVDEFGLTALLEAATEGHVEVVNKLLTAKADVNAVDEFGRTALQKAAGCDGSLEFRLSDDPLQLLSEAL
jgi:ankyrin repeat protein